MLRSRRRFEEDLARAQEAEEQAAQAQAEAAQARRERDEALVAQRAAETARVAADDARGPRNRPATFLAPVVVSAMDIKATFLDLLPAGAVPSALRHRMRGYEMPFPLSVLYLVLGTAGVIARRRRYTVAGSAEPESSR